MSCSGLPENCGPSGNGSCCDSAAVPGGTFYRSYDTASDAAFPSMANPASVSAFRLDMYEVTVARFRQFVTAGMGTQSNPPVAGSGAHPNLPGSGWDASWNVSLAADTTALIAGIHCTAQFETYTDAPGANENRPMNCLSWYEAFAFCIWDGGYLPTEAEWNFVASGGGEQRAFPWSSPASSLTIDDSTYASYDVGAPQKCMGDGVSGCSMSDLVPVGSKSAGNGRWGHADLAGNTFERVLDWNAGYINPCNDCANLGPGTDRVLRGGSYSDPLSWLRTGERDFDVPTTRFDNVGVRCARPL
ncbi:MAG TPA: SUMF1/EgtB/PvdO family nonheme iron enzyme [Kofleriaceae bacterium]